MIIPFLLTLLVIGVLWYCAETYLPLPAPMRVIVRVVFFVVVVVYICRYAGVL